MIRANKQLLSLAGLSCAGGFLVFACGGGSDGTGGPSGVASIALTASNTDVIASLGETRTITAVAKDAAGATLNAPSLTWTSSSPAVATVAGSGSTATVTSIGNGTATITATSGSVQGTATVTVTQKAVTMGVTGIPSAMVPGATAQLASEARDARGRAVAGASGVTFTSSNQAVAVVTAAGLVTAISPGSAQITITATVGGTALTGNGNVSVAFASAASPTTESVAATDGNAFNPSTVTVATGGTVTWTFASVLHNVTFAGGAGAPAQIPNTSGQQASRTFGTAGRFDYNCTLHPGMAGTVIVQAAGATPGFTTILSGANERPNAVTTTGAGAASFTVSGTTVSYVVTFSRLSGAPIMAHIHGPGNANQTVGVLVDFPTAGQTLTNGVLTGTFNAASIRNAAVSLDSLLVLMRNGNAYVNVHTTLNPAGEIRGQLSGQ